MLRFHTRVLGALLAIGIAYPAMAASEPSTRLVKCGTESCLLISGNRDNAAAAVTINGHVVAVEGGQKWRAIMPVDAVRAWSEPYARTITVAVDTAETEADLPIGLLGHAENLALLVVRVK